MNAVPEASENVPKKEEEPKVKHRPRIGPGLVPSLTGIVNHEDMDGLRRSQDTLTSRLTQTTDRLREFNQFSCTTLQIQQWKFQQHTKLLVDLHKDLTAVTVLARSIRQKLDKQYPDITASVSAQMTHPADLKEEMNSGEPDPEPEMATANVNSEPS